MKLLIDCAECGKDYIVDSETKKVSLYDNTYDKDTEDEMEASEADSLHGIKFTCECGEINELEHWTRTVHRVGLK